GRSVGHARARRHQQRNRTRGGGRVARGPGDLSRPETARAAASAVGRTSYTRSVGAQHAAPLRVYTGPPCGSPSTSRTTFSGAATVQLFPSARSEEHTSELQSRGHL